MTDLSGQYLGRYYLSEPLGEGGMAVVYKAIDTRLERDVAIKIIRSGAFPANATAELLKRFEREAKSLAKLSYPNIVKVHDYGEHEGSPYLVMEYLPGGTLKKLLAEPISWQGAIRLLLPIARSVAYAHQRGILHRDIKPANILITESGEPMLTDFGIAKLFEGDQSTALTGSGMAIGTPEYMAPEQWTGITSPQSDLYSLGIVLYEMVAGRKPYEADTPAAILIMQATEPLPSPRKFAVNLPDALELVLIKTLAKEPEDRYKDLNTFITALENLLVDEPVISIQTMPWNKDVKDKIGHGSVFTKALSKLIPTLKLGNTPAKFFTRIAGVFGIIIVLLWGGSLVMPHLLPLMSIVKPDAPIMSTVTYSLPIKTLFPTAITAKTPTFIPTSISTLTLTPTAIPLSSILLQQDFENNNTSGWYSYNEDWTKRKEPNWTIEQEPDGNHYASASGLIKPPDIWYGDNTVNWNNYAFESRVMFVVGTTIGIHVYSSLDGGYTVTIQETGNISFSQYTPLIGFKDLGKTTSKALDRETWYTIRVEIKGDALKVYIDNSLATVQKLPTPLIITQGGVEYSIGGLKIYLDDIKVWSLK